MTDPRIEGPFDDLKFRGPVRHAPPNRDTSVHFWIGVVIFLLVALVYPFYSYQVQTRLAARDVAVALNQFNDQMGELANDARRQSEAASRASAAQVLAGRLRGVKVAGTTMVGGNRIVIVDLGQASLAEATDIICRQAAARYREPLSGQRLRVQRHRGRQPAVDAGTIVCN